MATIAELRQRWLDVDGQRLTRAVRSWLMGRAPRPYGLSVIDGRVDLRGISLACPTFILGNKEETSAGVRWDSLDFRRAQLIEPRFFAARIENCLFDSADLFDWRLWAPRSSTARSAGHEFVTAASPVVVSGTGSAPDGTGWRSIMPR